MPIYCCVIVYDTVHITVIVDRNHALQGQFWDFKIVKLVFLFNFKKGLLGFDVSRLYSDNEWKNEIFGFSYSYVILQWSCEVIRP